MAHFAEIDENSIVKRVIVAEQDFIDSGAVGDPKNWVQTSYNTLGGIHYDPTTKLPSGKSQLRKNYAGIGFTYDKTRDAFIPPKPFQSWVLDENTCIYKAPVEKPIGDYVWDEVNVNWKKYENI